MSEVMIANENFVYAPHFLTVNQHKMHYVKEGTGIPIVFVHGVPTYSYVWRNIFPHLSDVAECIALDLIGYGLSDKPSQLTYNFATQQVYFKGFMDQINLDKFILVMHGYGSILGFDYARKHSDKVQGLVFLESHLRPGTDLKDTSLAVQELILMAKNNPKGLEHLIFEENYFIENILPASILRKLSNKEMSFYRQAFAEKSSRKVLWDFLQDAPFLHTNADIFNAIEAYSAWLKQTNIPKLMLYGVPGFLTTIATVHWAKENLLNLTLTDIGESLHVPQETHPDAVGHAIRQWFNENIQERRP